MAVIQKTPETTQAVTPQLRHVPSEATPSATRATALRHTTPPATAPAVRSTTQSANNAGVDKLRLTYTVLLGAAACMALVGVITQNQASDAGAPDAPPPAVLEQSS